VLSWVTYGGGEFLIKGWMALPVLGVSGASGIIWAGNCTGLAGRVWRDFMSTISVELGQLWTGAPVLYVAWFVYPARLGSYPIDPYCLFPEDPVEANYELYIRPWARVGFQYPDSA
jgi:hypothetical protein